jgi:methylenetetrahydrofolate dehydrogenase (NADP+) / methenyltetrahydrofolate cyclohydrolase
MPIILDGKKVANEIAEDLKKRCEILKANHIFPKLIIFTNTDDASKVYVRNKVKRCEEIGIEAITYPISKFEDFGVAANTYDFYETPYILQEPSNLTKFQNTVFVDQYYHTDVDGFSASNLGKLFKNEEKDGLTYFKACTPKGIITLLDYYNIFIESQKVVILGRSNIVGRPMAAMMLNRDATVSVCHSKTPRNIFDDEISTADIIISAVGKANMLSDYSPWIYQYKFANKILIDVGMNRDENGKLCGDFCKEVLEHCYAYTPVPGGVGPMTVISLCENVIEFYENGKDAYL